MTDDAIRFDYVLTLADSALILAQQLTRWCGHGPAIEEDIALSNVALDLLGQARIWYGYAGELDAAHRSEDELAYWRDAHQWRNLLLVEQPNGNYADTMARQLLFDLWHQELLMCLTKSSDRRIAEISAKAIKEVAYHVRRSVDLVVRLGDGTHESHAKMQRAFDDLWTYSGELFDDDPACEELYQNGIATQPSALREAWDKELGDVFAEATLARPADTWMQRGSKQGRHSEGLGYILTEMQVLQRNHPGARW